MTSQNNFNVSETTLRSEKLYSEVSAQFCATSWFNNGVRVRLIKVFCFTVNVGRNFRNLTGVHLIEGVRLIGVRSIQVSLYLRVKRTKL